ncbi:MAG TPA: hypothetical protein VK697_08985, partial [Methylomirabilota bacterium]|nr:hypothetical protein [Methylomirabilota bacterium]
GDAGRIAKAPDVVEIANQRVSGDAGFEARSLVIRGPRVLRSLSFGRESDLDQPPQIFAVPCKGPVGREPTARGCRNVTRVIRPPLRDGELRADRRKETARVGHVRGSGGSKVIGRGIEGTEIDRQFGGERVEGEQRDSDRLVEQGSIDDLCAFGQPPQGAERVGLDDCRAGSHGSTETHAVSVPLGLSGCGDGRLVRSRLPEGLKHLALRPANEFGIACPHRQFAGETCAFDRAIEVLQVSQAAANRQLSLRLEILVARGPGDRQHFVGRRPGRGMVAVLETKQP